MEPCRYEDIRHTSFQLHPCGGLPTERCFRLAVLSFLLSFCYRFHALCKLENHVARQCCSTRLQRTKPFHLCPSIYHVSHVKGFAQESSGLLFFCFLFVLQGIEHAFRKTDMRILISYMGFFNTLSHGTSHMFQGDPPQKHFPLSNSNTPIYVTNFQGTTV